ncbi:MAG: hypothetical protein AAF221_12970 [Pseudomonadota bacterium]
MAKRCHVFALPLKQKTGMRRNMIDTRSAFTERPLPGDVVLSGRHVRIERWLDPANFDAAGKQRWRLEAL